MNSRLQSILSPLIALAALAAPAAGQQAKTPATPRDTAWAKVEERMTQSALDSLNQINPTLKQHLDPVFSDAKDAAKPFADGMLGLGGKLLYFDCLAKPTVNRIDKALYDWFGIGHPGLPIPPELEPLLPDPFQTHIRWELETKVLKIDRLRKAVDAAMAEYAANLQAEENRLLVALRADLPDDALAGKLALPAFPFDATFCPTVDEAIAAVAESARNDVIVLIARETASWFLGNKAGELLNRKDDHFIKKTAINIMAGKTVDDTLRGAIDISGYDPNARIVGHVQTALDELQSLIVEGDAEERRLHRALFMLAEGYPEAEVRQACAKAMKALEQSGNPGLRTLMETMQIRRGMALHVALHRQHFGPKADSSRLYGIDPAKSAPRDQLLKLARDVFNDYQED